MSKKKVKTDDGLLKDALVPVEEQPYEIPSHWKWVRLGDLVSLKSGTTLAKDSELEYGDILYLKVGDMNLPDNQKEINTSSRYVNLDSKIEKQIVPAGSVLFPKRGGAIYTNKKRISRRNIIIDLNIMAITPNKYLYLEYLYFWFLTIPLEKLNNGSSVPQINNGDITPLLIPLPPLDEQKRIADKIERMLDKINQSKQLIEEAKQTFELRRAAILDKAFSGELTKKWREENKDNLDPFSLYHSIYQERVSVVESKRELQEINEMYSEIDINSCIDHNGWLRLKMNMFCYNINCGGTPTGDITNEGEVPFLKVYNIVNNKIDFEYKPQFIPNSINKSKLKKSILVPNDVIMNIVGPPLKKIAMIPDSYPEWNMNQAIVRFRPLSSVNPMFVYYGLQYDETLKEVMNATKGVVGQANISINQSRNLIMPIPSLKEQYQIIRLIEDLINKEDQSLENLDLLINQLNTLENSILAQAFKGKLK